MEDSFKIKKIVFKIIELFGFKPEISLITREKTILINIQTEDPSLLIGKRGANLMSLQYLIRLLVAKKLKRTVNLIVDVSDYWQKQKEQITFQALKAGDIVKKTGLSQILRPMNSYERRIIHIALKDDTGVMTESRGEGLDRRVVIKKKK